MKKIVKAPIDVQKRCLKLAGEKIDKEIKKILSCLEGQIAKTDSEVSRVSAVHHKECYEAYLGGWRGNYAEPEHEPEETQGGQVSEVSQKQIGKPTDLEVAKKFMSLSSNANRRGKDFGLTLAEVRRLLSLKRCQLTGVEMTLAGDEPAKGTDRTIDRVDASKGYVVGNVAAVCYAANMLKAQLFEGATEQPEMVTVDFVGKLVDGINKLSKSQRVEDKSE